MVRNPVASLIEGLAGGGVAVVDLTQPLNEKTPVIQLPEPFVNTPGMKAHEISRYDERGPAWAWRWLEIGEHTGTHLDAPIHWISGRDSLDVSEIPPRHLIAPAVVIDRSAESTEDPDYLLTVDDIRRSPKVAGCYFAPAGTPAPTTKRPSSTPPPAARARPASTPIAPAGSPMNHHSLESASRLLE
jgi:hypothetical protein